MIHRIEVLTEESLPKFEKLTYSQFCPFLKKSLNDENVISGIASFMGEPAGLVIAEKKSEQKLGYIFFLYVSPRYRRLGIGSGLLEFVEDRLWEIGCERLEVGFTGPKECKPEITRLLTALGWSNLKNMVELHRLDMVSLAQEKWVNRPIPSGYKVLRWDRLPNDIKEQIKIQNIKDPAFLSPFMDSKEFPHHLPTSLCLIRDERVICWVMTSIMSPDALMYDMLYAVEELRSTGKAIQLVALALKEQARLKISQVVFHVNIYNKEMIKFVERRLLQHEINKAVHWTAIKYERGNKNE